MHRVNAVAVQGGIVVGAAGDPSSSPSCARRGSRFRRSRSPRATTISLAACRAQGWPFRGYRLPSHPLQRRLAAELGPTLGQAIDGCGVPTYALSLRESAGVLLRIRPEIAAAMRAPPEVVGGGQADDTALMQALPGWTAKRGAERLLCAASPDGLGLALEVEDGNPRGLRPAVGAFLARLGLEADGFGPLPLCNSRDEPVGEIAVAAA